MPNRKGAISPMEAKFVERYVETGDATYAAAKAGYASPQPRGSQNLAKPALQEAIKREQATRLINEALPLAIQALVDILTSSKATERGKLTAIALTLKHTLGASVEASEGKEPHEMSAAELQRRIEALRREAADRSRPVIEGDASTIVEASQDPGVFG